MGASCTNLISFSPTVGGSISGSLVVADDALNAPAPSYTTQTIALSGTAPLSAPTIAFTVPNHTYGDAPFTVAATSNSTGAFTYTVVSGPATISGTTVTLTGTGTVVLQASEAADSNYTAATGTFFPATIPAGAATTPIVLIVQTTPQNAHNENFLRGRQSLPLTLALLLMPFAGLKSVRKRLRHLPTLLALFVFSLVDTLA